MLYYSKDIESFGTGLKRIADVCKTVGVRYEFQKLKSGFVVCFYREHSEADKEPIEADKKPIKADKEPKKADKEPKKADKKPIKADKEPKKADKEPIKADKKPPKADKKLIKASREKAVIEYIREHGYITNSAARELLGLADSTAKRLLKDLVDRGSLVVEGERKGRKYLLNIK